MKIYHFARSHKMPITQDVAWAFFSNPANLLQLTPPWARMADESLEKPKTVFAGLIQIYKMKILGVIPSCWVAEITHLDAPNSFIDEQKSGPFAFWHHRHSLKPIPNGVEVSDSIHYAMPFGPFGAIAHQLFVRRQLTEIFNYRTQMLEEFFGTF